MEPSNRDQSARSTKAGEETQKSKEVMARIEASNALIVDEDSAYTAEHDGAYAVDDYANADRPCDY